jgi:hypothetical protein
MRNEAMKWILLWGIAAMLVVSIGCNERFVQPDLISPSPPQGIYTENGDNFVELFWNRNPEPDVAGYNVYVSSSLNGSYQFIGSTKSLHFVDDGARNGYTYYYAVTAFDFDDNESDLSHDIAYDTPRPEGYDVALGDYRVYPGQSGYDFSTYSIGPYDDKYTDIFFENYNSAYYLDVWEDTDVQDVGYTNSLYDVDVAPVSGWSPTKDVRLIVGHTYVVWTWDNHYAKVRITALSPARVTFDWAYQLQDGNPRLKVSAGQNRGNLVMGSGALNRM